ncbi:hypothetical protein ACJX0J_022578, partial [Zea mays]
FLHTLLLFILKVDVIISEWMGYMFSANVIYFPGTDGHMYIDVAGWEIKEVLIFGKMICFGNMNNNMLYIIPETITPFSKGLYFDNNKDICALATRRKNVFREKIKNKEEGKSFPSPPLPKI